MQIQIWKRRTKDKTKYNLYLRYRINQNKAKVESMRLWEWINPSNKIQEEHNDSVKKASEEIIRRVKDDIENDRVSISFENKKKTYLKDDFLTHTKIKNKEADNSIAERVSLKKFLALYLQNTDTGFRKQDTLNFTLGFQKDDISISVWGKNINDDEYLTSAFVAVADLSETTFFGYPNAYKTYGVTLNYSF